MISSENIYSNNIIFNQQVKFKNIYLYTNTYKSSITINKKRSHEYGKEQGPVYGNVWREEGERTAIKLQSQI